MVIVDGSYRITNDFVTKNYCLNIDCEKFDYRNFLQIIAWVLQLLKL